MLNVIMPNVIMLNVIMLNVIMLNVIMLNVIMLNVIMLNIIMYRLPVNWLVKNSKNGLGGIVFYCKGKYSGKLMFKITTGVPQLLAANLKGSGSNPQ
jgi:hypothetical protein